MTGTSTAPGRWTSQHPDSPPIERASPTDRAFLAMDRGGVPEQFGVILLLDRSGDVDLPRSRRVIGERILALPRLRQRLTRTPLGCGGPIWVDDPGFDIRNHVRAIGCRPPGDEQDLLDTAMSVILEPLPRDAPLWSAVFVTGLEDGGVALVVVLHHVLADGVGGLEVLASLVDEGGLSPRGRPFPRARPGRRALATDAFRSRMRGLRGAGRSWLLLRRAMSAGGGVRPPRAAPCSLVQPNGPRRRPAVVRTGLDALQAAAHRNGATTNDAVLVAVAGALSRVLATRGEDVDAFAVAVPVSGRATEDGSALGNLVGPLLVSVPTTGDVERRLARVAEEVRAHKAAATGPPPIALLGWLFRPLAALGGYRWYMSHQHRLHTLVSHVRGPDAPVTFDGSTVRGAIPLGALESGNFTVHFQVLSYAGTLTITAVVDPDHFPDLDLLTEGLRTELDLILRAPWPGGVST